MPISTVVFIITIGYTDMKQLEDYIISIIDFPKEGIVFRDVTSIIADRDGFGLTIDMMMEKLKGVDFDYIVGIESRGFIFGSPLAYNLSKGLLLIRKKGKLPREVISESYDLEYGTSTIEMHTDSLKKGDKVVIIDDLLATGGTVQAATHLIEKLGGIVVMDLFVMELSGLKGRERLSKYRVEALVDFPVDSCQSCSMPLTSVNVMGTNKDGSKNRYYCEECYQNGEFTQKDMTVEKMIAFVEKGMRETYPNRTMDECHELVSQIIPTLMRWKK